MHRDEIILDRIKKLTFESSFKKDCGKTVRVAAAVYSGNDLIAQNTNKSKSHPIQKYYNKFVPYDRPCHLHAEVATLIDANKKIDKNSMRRCTIYIARKLNIDGFGSSRPCPACMKAIKDAGIKKLVYTTETGYAIEFIKD